jgi:hypothetical protein
MSCSDSGWRQVGKITPPHIDASHAVSVAPVVSWIIAIRRARIVTDTEVAETRITRSRAMVHVCCLARCSVRNGACRKCDEPTVTETILPAKVGVTGIFSAIPTPSRIVELDVATPERAAVVESASSRHSARLPTPAERPPDPRFEPAADERERRELPFRLRQFPDCRPSRAARRSRREAAPAPQPSPPALPRPPLPIPLPPAPHPLPAPTTPLPP